MKTQVMNVIGAIVVITVVFAATRTTTQVADHNARQEMMDQKAADEKLTYEYLIDRLTKENEELQERIDELESNSATEIE